MNTKFEIGDHVKFLNIVGCGVVKRIENGMIYVEDETGFDMPMAPNELIRIADQKGVAKAFNPEMPKTADTKTAEQSKPLKPSEAAKRVNAIYNDAYSQELEAENRRLVSQVASLKEQVRKLQGQVINLQRTLAKLS